MANSRNYKKGWLVDDRFGDLSLDAKSALLTLFDKTDDIGLIPNPKSALRGQGIAINALQELTDSGYLLRISNKNHDLYLFKEWSGIQHLRYFNLSGIFNQSLLPNLFVDDDGFTVFKNNLLENNNSFIENHFLLIENIYSPSAIPFKSLGNWLQENQNTVGNLILSRLNQLTIKDHTNAESP